MISRLQFLRSLGLLLAAPFAARALAAKPQQPTSLDLTDWTYEEGPTEHTHGMGLAIKVPSNRVLVEDRDSICRIGYHPGRNGYHRYLGNWNGTFKLERGCSNPAWVWFDLCERAYGNRPKRLAAEIAQRITPDTMEGRLDLRDLYEWGCWADELVIDADPLNWELAKQTSPSILWAPRNTINAFVDTPEKADRLRDQLRLQFVFWRNDRDWLKRHEEIPLLTASPEAGIIHP